MSLGVLIFFLGANGIAFGFLTKDNPLLALSVVAALILLGLGGFLKKKRPK